MIILNDKSLEFTLNQLFLKSIVGKSADHFYELAKQYYKDEDYSASIALCTRCLYLCESKGDFDLTKPLFLIAQNLYECNLERWIFLRPLAMGIIIRRIRNKGALTETMTDSGIDLGIIDLAVLALLIARMILFEQWGVFPKSFRMVSKKIFNVKLRN